MPERNPNPSPERVALECRRDSIRAIRDPLALASHLGLSWPFIRYNLYRLEPTAKYREFTIRKRNGSERVISAPCAEIRSILRRILERVLNEVYQKKGCVHGFARNCSIQAGASPHQRSRFVLNLDLKDFFPSIHFGRVLGTLKNRPYNIPNDIAVIIAHACCWNGYLPQGAPTSPILSNMVCGRLDSALIRFSRANGLTYTRYADDLTFSTNRRAFPDVAAVRIPTDPRNASVAGTELERIITANGFEINHAKTRLKERPQRLEVTGLVVNKKVNVKRTFIRAIRGALHALEKFGTRAEDHFQTRFNTTGSRALTATLAGKIDFLRQIRGPLDPLYLRLADRAYRIDPQSFDAPDRSNIGRFVSLRTWIIEGSDHNTGEFSQGSGFFIAGVGIVTCAHVTLPSMEAYRAHDPQRRYEVRILRSDPAMDLCVLHISGTFESYGVSLRPKPALHENVYVCGFPNYSNGSPSCTPACVTAFRRSGISERFLVSAAIVKGTSGGPILDRNWKVVGIAVTGGANTAHLETDIDSACICVSDFRAFVSTYFPGTDVLEVPMPLISAPLRDNGGRMSS